jgi:class 3 adenylate cyclase
LTLGKTALTFPAAVLFADVRTSSRLTDDHRRVTVARALNAFLNGVARITRAHNGQVRSFNGDAALAFFAGSGAQPSISATLAALQIATMVSEILAPQMKSRWDMDFDAGIGVAYGKILVTRVGIRGTNELSDLIWPASATNLAAKLGQQARHPDNVAVAEDVYQVLPDTLRWDRWWIFKDWHGRWAKKRVVFGSGEVQAYSTRDFWPLDGEL